MRLCCSSVASCDEPTTGSKHHFLFSKVHVLFTSSLIRPLTSDWLLISVATVSRLFVSWEAVATEASHKRVKNKLKLRVPLFLCFCFWRFAVEYLCFLLNQSRSRSPAFALNHWLVNVIASAQNPSWFWQMVHKEKLFIYFGKTPLSFEQF